MNVSQLTAELRRNQPCELQWLSQPKAERIVALALLELPSRDGPRIHLRRLAGGTWKRYRETYGLDPLVWLLLVHLVRLLLAWWLASGRNRQLALRLQEELRFTTKAPLDLFTTGQMASSWQGSVRMQMPDWLKEFWPFSFDLTDLVKIAKGALIAAAGAALTYFAEGLSGLDFGPWTAIVTASLSILVNAVRKGLGEPAER